MQAWLVLGRLDGGRVVDESSLLDGIIHGGTGTSVFEEEEASRGRLIPARTMKPMKVREENSSVYPWLSTVP